MNIRTFHYVSGIVLTLFIAPHLYNHLQSLVSIDAHIRTMDTLRIVYRNLFVEGLILISVIVQIISGITLYRKTPKQNLTGFEKLHVKSGLYLAFFFCLHVNAVLLGRAVLHLDTNFYFGTAGINTFPFSLFFVPYYTLAILSFFGHLAAIHNKKMRHTVVGISTRTQSIGIIGAGIVVTALTLYGMTNRFNGITLPAEYNVMIGK